MTSKAPIVYQTPPMSLQSPVFLSDLLPPTSLSLTPLQLPWPPCRSSNTPSTVQAQGFASAVPSTRNITWGAPDVLLVSFLLPFGSLLQCHLFRKTFPDHLLTQLSRLPSSCWVFFFFWHSALPDTIYSSAYFLYSLSLPTWLSAQEVRDLDCFAHCYTLVPSTEPGRQQTLTTWSAFRLLTGITPRCLAQGSAARWVGTHRGPS